MSQKRKLQKIRFYLQYSPITLNAIILGLALLLAYWLLFSEQDPEAEQSSSFLPFLLLMSQTAFWFFCAFLSFSFLNTLFCWLYYLWLFKKKKQVINFEFQIQKNKSFLQLKAQLAKVLRPLLGTIKSRLVYDDYGLTPKFTLSGNFRKKSTFFRDGVQTSIKLNLPDIQSYNLKGGFVFFEDMLQLFSFPFYQQKTGRFFQAPRKIEIEEQKIVPRHTEDAQIKIDESRRIPGDYLNYKNFESGDDIRRIVWKVYAKNREFVVRIPEQRDLYASHIYFYASFFSSVPASQDESVFGKEMLNYYKNRVWSAYDVLMKKEHDIRFISDQNIQRDPHNSSETSIQDMISNSHWQRDKSANDYFKFATGSVLCISSFNHPEDVEEILSKCSQETVVYYVKLSRTFKHFIAFSWLAKLFLIPSEDRLKKVRGLWLFHPFRLQLQKREKEIESILEKSIVTVGIL